MYSCNVVQVRRLPCCFEIQVYLYNFTIYILSQKYTQMNALRLGLFLVISFVWHSASVAQTIFSEDFENATIPGVPAGWTETHSGAGDGFVSNIGAIYWNANPVPRHTKFGLVDESNHRGNTMVTLTSSAFSVAGLSVAWLSYDDFYFGGLIYSNTEKAYIQLAFDGTSTWVTVDTITTFSRSSWGSRSLDISSSVSGHSTAKMRLNYKNNSCLQATGLAIDNIIIYQPCSTDLALKSLQPQAGDPANDYYITGTGAKFSGTVVNKGASTITSFTIHHSTGSGTISSNTYFTSISPGGSFDFTDSLLYTVSAGLNYVSAWVSVAGDGDHANDTLKTTIMGVPSLPHKRPFFEEGTGTWCGYCVKGIIYFDSLWKLYPHDVSVVQVHHNDPMQWNNPSSISYDEMTQKYIWAYPTYLLDRNYLGGSTSALQDFTLFRTSFGFAEMQLEVDKTDSNFLKPTVKITPAINLSGDYRIEIIVTEDQAHGNVSGWEQENYYGIGGSATGDMAGCGYNFNDSQAIIPASSMYYNFVGRYTQPYLLKYDQNGVAGSLPAAMVAGTTYTATGINTVSPFGMLWNWRQLRFIALLIDNNPQNYSYGYVLNSVSTVQNMQSLGFPLTHSELPRIRIAPNPAIDKVRFTFGLTEAGAAQLSLHDVMGRLVYRGAAVQLSAGEQQFECSTADLPGGVYYVTVSLKDGVISDRFIVVK